MTDGLKIIHFNTQGFQNKVGSINNFVKVHKPDVLVVTEHFQKNKSDLERINGYTLVNSFCRKHNERGGVAIWARPDIPCNPRRDLDRHRKEKEFELVSVSVGDDVVVTGAYRPPSTSIPEFHVHLGRLIKKINKEPHIKHVLTGDFNIDNSKPNKTRTVLNENDLKFHISSVTHKNGRSIDNFITNFEASTSRVIKSKSSAFSDHHPIEITVHKKMAMIAKPPESFVYKIFRKMFFKSVESSPLRKQKSKNKYSKPDKSQSIFYRMFSSMFIEKIPPVGTQKPPVGNSSKTSQKKYSVSQKAQDSTFTSFFSKILTIITPNWLKSSETHSNFSTPGTSKKSSQKKPPETLKSVAVNSFSLFSSIIHFVAFVSCFFKRPTESSTSPSSASPHKETQQKDAHQIPQKERGGSHSFITQYFRSLFFNKNMPKNTEDLP